MTMHPWREEVFLKILTYDIAGRKTTMNDPDMGNWSYAYDALGNLKTQTDARGCITSLSYDPLNRLKEKTYTGTCSSTPGVTYGYDIGTNGKGRRTSMNTSGTGIGATWTYDARGRVTSEVKVVGTDQFKTMWSYNSADLIASITYPRTNVGWAGEVVTSSYHPQMAFNSLVGTTTYVQSTTYDAAGRTDLRSLGSSLQTDYDYFDWTTPNGLGRLKRIRSGTAANPTLLLDLRYYNTSNGASYYDAVGNIEKIDDYKMGNPQRQTFEYDAADRLKNAEAGGGTGGTYPKEIYTYDTASGNLATKAGMSYTYHATKKHAVTSTSSGWTFTYDNNGNMTTRTVQGVTYTLAYDAENRLTSVSQGGTVIASFFYDGDSGRKEHGNRVKSVVGPVTTTFIGSHFEYTIQSTQVPAITATPFNYGVACLDEAVGTGYILYSAERVATRFAANPPHTSNADHFICVKNDNGQWKYDNNTAYFSFTPEPTDILVASVNFDTDTVTKLQGQNSNVNAIVYGYASGNLSFTANRWGGTANPGEFEISGSQFTPHKLVTTRKYYSAGGQRIALRESGTLHYLFSDHLGSTSLTYRAWDGQTVQQLYKPWGEVRYTSGSLPTKYTYTGQYSNVSEFGLLFYNARWYDPALGRFAQADTIVPLQSQGVQAWDRFAYVNNNPVMFSDPSGHCLDSTDPTTCYGYEPPKPSLPGSIPNPENRTEEHIQDTWSYYEKTWN